MASFEIYQPSRAPSPLVGERGEAFLGAYGAAKDEVVARAKAALVARLPSYAPSDALSRLGDNVRLERGLSESEAAYRARLKTAFAAWAWGGTRHGLLEYALKPAGFPNADTIENRQWHPAPPDGNTAFWSRFWVVIGTPHPWETDGVWDGDDSTWDDDPTATWDSTATVNEVERIRRLIRQWKPGHATCVGVFIVFGPTIRLWDGPPAQTWGQAAAAGVTWGDGSALSIFWPG